MRAMSFIFDVLFIFIFMYRDGDYVIKTKLNEQRFQETSMATLKEVFSGQ
jgi:hypothetical protein